MTKDALITNTANDDEVTVYYLNNDDDNTALTITIERMDTEAEVYSSSSFADYDEVTIIFNHATLSNITDKTLFRVTATATNSDGTHSVLAYFNTGGAVGGLPSGLIFIVSLLLLLFGLTFTVTQTSFSWFGIIICIINFGILALAIPAWYITFMMAITAIVLVFIILVLVGKNKATIG